MRGYVVSTEVTFSTFTEVTFSTFDDQPRSQTGEGKMADVPAETYNRSTRGLPRNVGRESAP